MKTTLLGSGYGVLEVHKMCTSVLFEINGANLVALRGGIAPISADVTTDGMEIFSNDYTFPHFP